MDCCIFYTTVLYSLKSYCYCNQSHDKCYCPCNAALEKYNAKGPLATKFSLDRRNRCNTWCVKQTEYHQEKRTQWCNRCSHAAYAAVKH